MSTLKEKYRRFKAWQREPCTYKDCDGQTHCCANCNFEYVGAFCPCCGQKARAGRITWAIVRNGMMDVFGLGGRSMPNSLWQLLWRPGYFISDYINGKWQASFPPVKMLVLAALIFFFIGKLLYPEYWSEVLEDESVSTGTTGMLAFTDRAIDWMSAHPEWMLLFALSLLILPTWFVFRHSPRNARHTLPQGFFIQVFVAIQLILWLFIFSLIAMLFGLDAKLAAMSSIFIVPMIIYVDYRQLFGYGRWSTLWRMFVGLMMVILGILILLFISMGLVVILGLKPSGHPALVLLFMPFAGGFMGALASVTDIINRKLWRERSLWRLVLIPLLCVAVILLSAFAIEMIKPGALSAFFLSLE